MGFPVYPATERQQHIVTMIGELADIFARRANEGEWEGHFPYENYQDLKQAGYHTLTIPREYGGWGANVLEVMLAQARLAQGCASTALVMGMHLSTIGKMVSAIDGPNPLFEYICREVVVNGALINGAATEPSTGSPSRGGRPATIARRQADGSWLITGRKTFTTGSPVLQLFIVGCSLEDEAPGEANLPPLTSDRGSFIVTRNAPGVSIKETWNTFGMRITGSHDLILENVPVGAEAYTGTLENFTPAAQARQGAWGFPTAAVYLGIAQGARNEALSFARQRRPNSLEKPISSLPHIQEKVAKMELALLESEAVFFGVTEQFLKDPTSVPASQLAAAKYLVTNHAVEIVDQAMRLVGGASLSLNLPLQRYYRDVRAGLHHPPMDDATIALLSKEAFEEGERA